MAKDQNHSEGAPKPPAAAGHPSLAAAVKPVNRPIQNSQRSALLTSLASLWPTASKPAEKVATPTANQAVKVTFALFDPNAKQVALSGEFNGWAADAMPMERQSDGRWERIVELAPGRYEYKFVVDGNWKHDPQARVNVWNQQGTLNSVAQVWA